MRHPKLQHPKLWHSRPRADALANSFITGIDQVCIAVRDFDASIDALTKLGIGPFKCWTMKAPALFGQTFRSEAASWTMRLGVALVGRMQWEVIQPLDGSSLFTEHLARHGDGPHHILLETNGSSFDDSLARLDTQGFPFAQSAMLNLPLQLGALTVPAAPKALAEPLSTHFGYADTAAALGTTLELARFPPGISRPLGLRIGKADAFAPNDSTRITDRLPNAFIDRVEKLGFVVSDVRAFTAAWSDKCGVGPWHVVDLTPESIGEVKIGGKPGDFRARAAWTMVGSTLLEAIQPVAGDTPHARLLASKGSGLHYVGVRSDTLSIDDAVANFRAAGCETLLQGVLFGGYEFALVDAKPAHLWIELLSLDAELLYQQLRQLPAAKL